MSDTISEVDIKEILSRFDEETDVYQRDAVEKALSCRHELTPHLIKIFETLADNPLIYSLERHNGHVYAAALLAHFEETAAHLPLIRAFSIPKEQLDDLWGDMTTETLPTLLCRTCGGSLEAIKELAANRTVSEFVRSAASGALSYMVVLQPSRRDEVVGFLQGLFTGEEAEDGSYFWSYLAGTLCDLHPGESMEILRRANEAGRIHHDFISWEDIEEDNTRSREIAEERLRAKVARRLPVDVHGYIGWFAGWKKEEPASPPPPRTKEQKTKKTRRVKHKYKTGKKPGKKKR